MIQVSHSAPQDVRRVVVLSDDSFARGGATGLALASVRALRSRGIAVTYICGDAGQNPELEQLGVPVVALGQASLLEMPLRAVVVRGLFNTKTVEVIHRWVEQNDDPQTVYHVHTWTKVLSPSLYSALAPVQNRLLISAHDFFIVCPNGAYSFFDSGNVCTLRPMGVRCVSASCDRRSYHHKLWRVARQAMQQRLLDYRRGAPRVLIIHEAMRPILERGGVPPGTISTLRNPIQAWTSSRVRAEANREFIFVGRLGDEKGADLAAAAARRAGVKLRIVGDGPNAAWLRATYPEVTFDGQKSQAELADIAVSARALVMPSRYPEPFGLVAGEALWSGIPVITAESALMAPEIVRVGAGLACNPRDEHALAAAMRRLMEDDDETRRLSVNAFERTRHLASTPEVWIEELLGHYRDAVRAPGLSLGAASA